MTEKAVWHIMKESANSIGMARVAPRDLRRYAEWRNMPSRPPNTLWLADFLPLHELVQTKPSTLIRGLRQSFLPSRTRN